MGAYINPLHMTKEEWLQKNAVRITEEEFYNHKEFGDTLPVVLLHNHAFTAACIVFDENEMKYVKNPEDDRLKFYYTAQKKDLMRVSNLNYYLEEELEDE